MKSYIFIKEFISGLIKFRKKKPHIGKLQIWVGETCTLRCKECSQLFPYIPSKIYDIDGVIKNAKKITKLCEIDSFHIIGGEPFTNKDILKLIKFICSQKHKELNKIVSNGTIIPDEDTLKFLSENNENICVSISDYECAREKQQKLAKIFVERNINHFHLIEDYAWFYMGNPSQSEIKDKKAIYRNFFAYHDRTCITLADGELSICPRMHNSPKVFKHRYPQNEYLKISKLPEKPNHLQMWIYKGLIKAILTDKTYREACKFCYGNSNINNKTVKRAEQLLRG